VLKLDGEGAAAPLLNVFGGKLTTYRRLSEHALEKIGAAIGVKGAPWTAKSHLPGGNFAVKGYETEVAKLKRRYAFLADPHARRLVRRYGTRAETLLGDARGIEDLGRLFGGDLYEAEVRYLVEHEWARHAEDVLWRRTKDGLRLSKEQAQSLEEYMAAIPAMAG
jgi:glycerol-3-phosphate dehydrogenase